MSNNSANRKRAFAEAVSIDAWHQAFGPEAAKVDLHADVVFGTARVGGEADSPVRFRLRMKRADLVVVIPDSEPAMIDKQSVSRDAPQLRAHVKRTMEASATAGAEAQVEGGVSPRSASGSVKASASVAAKTASSRKIEVSGELGMMTVTQSRTADGDYRWSIEPSTGDYLEGRPWDGALAPRLKLIDRRKDRSKGIPPTVRVEVRCKREDIEITDLIVKDEGLWKKAKRRVGFKNRIRAAEAYIRSKLAEEGLEVSNIADAFGEITLASTTAEPATDK